MPVKRTQLQKAIGKLISLIQKEWGKEPGAFPQKEALAEEAMGKAHDLLMAASKNSVKDHLSGRAASNYLGEVWVYVHPEIKEKVKEIEEILKST